MEPFAKHAILSRLFLICILALNLAACSGFMQRSFVFKTVTSNDLKESPCKWRYAFFWVCFYPVTDLPNVSYVLLE